MFPKIMTKLILKLFLGCNTEKRKESTEIHKKNNVKSAIIQIPNPQLTSHNSQLTTLSP